MRVVAGATGYFELGPALSIRSAGSVPRARTDGTVRTMDVEVDRNGVAWFALENGQLAREPAGSAEAAPLPELTGLPTLRSLAIDGDGRQLIAAGPGGIVRWSTDGRRLLGVGFAMGENNSFSISADGELAMASTTSIVESQAYDLSGSTPEPIPLVGIGNDRMVWAGLDPLDRWVFSLAFGELALLDRETMRPSGYALPAVGGTVAQTMSPDGRWWLRLTQDGTVHRVQVVEVPTGQPVSPVIDLSPWRGGTTTNLAASSFSADATRLSLSLDRVSPSSFAPMTGRLFMSSTPMTLEGRESPGSCQTARGWSHGEWTARSSSATRTPIGRSRSSKAVPPALSCSVGAPTRAPTAPTC